MGKEREDRLMETGTQVSGLKAAFRVMESITLRKKATPVTTLEIERMVKAKKSRTS